MRGRAGATSSQSLRHELDAGKSRQIANLLVQVDQILLTLLIIEQVQLPGLLLVPLDAEAQPPPPALVI
jgi:hypothetical protein